MAFQTVGKNGLFNKCWWGNLLFTWEGICLKFYQCHLYGCVCVRSVISDSLSPPRTVARLCPWNFSGRNTGGGCHFLLQGIFPIQGLNPRLLHCQEDSCSWHLLLLLFSHSLLVALGTAVPQGPWEAHIVWIKINCQKNTKGNTNHYAFLLVLLSWGEEVLSRVIKS